MSCPSCGRTEVYLIAIARDVRAALADLTAPISVAVMGCEVNGPGEASEADVGLACGRRGALVFENGSVVRKIPHEGVVGAFVAHVRDFVARRQGGG